MRISLEINTYAFTFYNNWLWKGRVHGKPVQMDAGHPYQISWYWGWFCYTRDSTPLDDLKWAQHTDNVDEFLVWNNCISIPDYLEQNKEWI